MRCYDNESILNCKKICLVLGDKFEEEQCYSLDLKTCMQLVWMIRNNIQESFRSSNYTDPIILHSGLKI